MTKKKQKKEVKKIKQQKTVSFWKDKDKLLTIGLILGVTVLVFLSSLDNDFVNWDDEVNLLDNPYMAAFDWENIKGIFSNTVIGGYNPLSIFTFAIENALFGMENAFIYHLNNLILHLICVFFVYRIGLQLGLKSWGSILFAGLFAIHPMRVESIAWVTERKDVLYGAFYFAAFYYYLKYIIGKKKTVKFLYLTFVLFFFSLFAKIQAVALPLSMIAADYYFNRPLKIKLLLEKWAFFAMSLAIGLLGIYLLQKTGTIGGEDPVQYSFFERILVGFYSYAVYLIKFIFPYEMSPLYPYLKELTWPFYVTPFIVLAVLAGTFVGFRKNWKPLVFGIVFFTVNVVFLLQVVGAGQGFIADRFTYVPYFGLFFIAAWYFQQVLQNKPKWKNALLGAAGAYLLIFAYMTFRQNDVWANGETLWTQAIAVNDKNATVWGNRGNYYREGKRYQKALNDYAEAIRLSPNKGSVYNSRGKAYFNMGNFQMALQDYNQAVRFDETKEEYWANRGAANGGLKNYDQALKDLAKCIELNPEFEKAYQNRLVLLYELGRFQEALKDHDSYLTIDPFDGDIWFSRGLTNRQLGNESAALEDLNIAIQINPNQAAFVFERAKVNNNLGNKEQGIQDALRARQLGMQIDENMMARFYE